MRWAAIAFLGITVGVTSLTPIAYGKTPQQSSKSSENSVTLSGESLQTIEGRTVSDDSQDFFPGTLPADGNSETTPAAENQSSPGLSVTDGVVLTGGDTTDSGDPLELFESPGDIRDGRQVNFELQID